MHPTKFCWMLPGRSIFNRRKNFETLVTLELQGFQMKMAEGILNSFNSLDNGAESLTNVLSMSSLHGYDSIVRISILNNKTIAKLDTYTAGTNQPLSFLENEEIDLYTGYYGVSVPFTIQLISMMTNISTVPQQSVTLTPQIIKMNQLISESKVVQHNVSGTPTDNFKFYFTISYEFTNFGTHINIKLDKGTHSHTNGYSGSTQELQVSVSIGIR